MKVGGAEELAESRSWLADPDPQVRLNAAVRLSYLGCADGVDELVQGLSHPVGAIGLVQVPEALALLGEVGLEPARALVRQSGPARPRLAAARTLTHVGELDGVVAALADILGDPDPETHSEAASLLGELGPAASGAFDALVSTRAVHEPKRPLVRQALAAVGGPRALPLLDEALDDAAASVRVSAMWALAGLGTNAESMWDRLSGTVRDHSLPLWERLAAVHALTRVDPRGDDVARQLCALLPAVDRWYRIGLLRALGQLAPDYPRRAETSQTWPLWASRFSHSAPTGRIEADREVVLGTLAASLDDDDHDVRRNAAMAIAFFGPAGRSVADRVRNAPRLSEALRHEVLRSLRVISTPKASHGRFDHLDPRGWPWELVMTQPEVDLDAVAAYCEKQWAHADGADLAYRIPVPKWQFLHYLVERRGLLVHGSRTPDIDVLKPVSRSWGGGRTSGQPGIFAVDHALMAMYFGIMDRSKLPNLNNGTERMRRPDGTYERCFSLGTGFVALADRPYIDATVYVLPPDTFSMMGELTSLVPVRPLARLAITPGDFPKPGYLWGSDIGPLSSQFGFRRFPFLNDVGAWPVKDAQM